MGIICRALDVNHDWEFGAGLNNYVSNNAEVAQDINMNLNMFLGDCFFATNVGIDWFNLLGGKNELAVNLSINATILNTLGVTGLLQTSTSLVNRKLNVQYQVQTVYGTFQNTYVYDIGISTNA
jgi:hypothetical protein